MIESNKINLNSWIKTPSKHTTNYSKRFTTKKAIYSTKKKIGFKSTGEDEYLDEIDRFFRYTKPTKKYISYTDFVKDAEQEFNKDVSLRNLKNNMRTSIFREGLRRLYNSHISKFEIKKIKGKTREYKGISFKKFNLIFTKRGMRYINKETGRFIKKPQSHDFI